MNSNTGALAKSTQNLAPIDNPLCTSYYQWHQARDDEESVLSTASFGVLYDQSPTTSPDV